MRDGKILAELEGPAGPAEPENILKFYEGSNRQTKALGIPFGKVLAIAKKSIGLPIAEIESLLESDDCEAWMCGVGDEERAVFQRVPNEVHRRLRGASHRGPRRGRR